MVNNQENHQIVIITFIHTTTIAKMIKFINININLISHKQHLLMIAAIVIVWIVALIVWIVVATCQIL